ncbi:uncharacterized protein LOC122147389 isoform X2 [Cyprinus carpio]|uniref:Uncharacterized protein LOC122147389 isoform X2 n=1 Tax=Cyprinus carpio TaxID=7962 RepID=A0A9Q9YTS6_CYPCA|nr:uncharacterized protein LOC122147389 isoform X2 [Cyprinus carpio]
MTSEKVFQTALQPNLIISTSDLGNHAKEDGSEHQRVSIRSLVKSMYQVNSSSSAAAAECAVSTSPPSVANRLNKVRRTARRSNMSSSMYGSAGLSGSQSIIEMKQPGWLSRAGSEKSVRNVGRGKDVFDGMDMMGIMGNLSGLNSLDMHHDESVQNQQMLGAAYVQHECYHNNDAKKPLNQLKGTPLMLQLFTSKSQEVQRYTTGATRNLIYENMENKVALIEDDGNPKLIEALREPDDELRKNITAMASPRGHHQRRSTEKPVNMASDVIYLKEELTRLQKNNFPECNKYIEKISYLIDEFYNGYRLAIYVLKGAVITGGITMVLLALSLFVIGEKVSEFSYAAMTVVAVLSVAFGLNRKTHQEKILKRTMEEELKGFQDTINPIIDMLERICQRTEEILRDPSLSDHKTQALSEHFAYCYEKSLFREHDSSKVGDRLSKIVHLSGKLSEMIAKVSSVPDIIKEIIEDDKRQHDKPAKPTHEQINKREFKEKAEKFINEMRKGICELKNGVKEVNQTADRKSNRLS